MDKLRVFNIALQVFNMAPLSEEELEADDRSEHPEIEVLELLYTDALRRVMRERNWTFLEERLELGDDLGGMDGYRHSYKLPEKLFRITRADGIYRVVKGLLLTNGRPVAYGQMLDVPDAGVPDDFEGLVAYALAIEASGKLSPGDSKLQFAMTLYNTRLLNMMLNDVQGNMSENMEVANGYGDYV